MCRPFAIASCIECTQKELLEDFVEALIEGLRLKIQSSVRHEAMQGNNSALRQIDVARGYNPLNSA